MPLYQYRCPKHGEFEVKRSFDDDTSQLCDKCHREAKRVISLTPVHYQGTGWYYIDSGQRYRSQLTKTGREIYERKVKSGQIRI